MRNASVIGRIAAGSAVAVAIILVVLLVVVSGGSDYKVYAIFQDASQIYSGNQVNVAGNPWTRSMALVNVSMSDAVNSVQIFALHDRASHRSERLG